MTKELESVIDLIKAGEEELVKQLLIGNPELHINLSNNDLSRIHQIIWPEREPLDNWFIVIDNIMHTAFIWLTYWAEFNFNERND